MSKLYFFYGTVFSAKTLNLLASAHSYKIQGKHVLLLKPKADNRFGAELISTRAGLSAKADILIDQSTQFSVTAIDDKPLKGIDCILVDEAQFLPVAAIEALHLITREAKIPVLCYGLRTDYRTHFFAASQRLFEIADRLNEVKTICHYCNCKAVFNLKIDKKSQGVTEGPQIELGDLDLYLPVCKCCYHEHTHLPSTPTIQ